MFTDGTETIIGVVQEPVSSPVVVWTDAGDPRHRVQAALPRATSQRAADPVLCQLTAPSAASSAATSPDGEGVLP
jgi:hypothetical protein